MMTNIRSYTIAGIVASLACFAAAQSKSVPETRDITVRSFEGAGLNGMDALAKLSAQTGLPMGIEWARASAGSTITQSWTRAKASTIAREIAALSDPKGRYFASVRNGVLEVRPAPSLRHNHSIADFVVTNFALRNNSQPTAAKRLMDFVHCKILANCGGTEIYSGEGGEVIPDRDYHNIPVVDILDDLVTAGRTMRIWIIVEDPGHVVDKTDYWQTLTLPLFRNISDAEQPWWLLLRWREEPTGGGFGGAWACPRCWEPPRHTSAGFINSYVLRRPLAGGVGVSENGAAPVLQPERGQPIRTKR